MSRQQQLQDELRRAELAKSKLNRQRSVAQFPIVVGQLARDMANILGMVDEGFNLQRDAQAVVDHMEFEIRRIYREYFGAEMIQPPQPDDNRLESAQVMLLWTALRVARQHITDPDVLADIDRAIEPLEQQANLPRKKGCPMPSHHPDCDCNGEGGDR